MLWCDTAGSEPVDLEDLSLFVARLSALGYPARIGTDSLPAGLSRNLEFDLAPWLADGPPDIGSRRVLIAGQRLTEARLAGLRRSLGAGPAQSALVYGRFETRQARIGLRAKLGYVFGADPDVLDVPSGLQDGGGRGVPVFGVPIQGGPGTPAIGARPGLLLAGPPMQERAETQAILALGLTSAWRLTVLTDGKSKQAWRDARGPELPVFQYAEASPMALAVRTDVLACFGSVQRNHRLQALLADLIAAGRLVLDCTPDHGLAAQHPGVLRAPQDVAALTVFLATDIAPNLAALQRTAASRPAGEAFRIQDALGMPPAPARAATGGPARRVIFMPTNGVGLGHAQRCSLIAGALDPARVAPLFAAFPSCLSLLRRQGFAAMPLVARSALHAQPHAADLANFTRLFALGEGAAAFVFDGGHVFDSVFRTILERRLAAVWIRRGLWNAGLDASVSLDREKVFARVVVPREAFDELNHAYSRGPHVTEVGPVLRRLDLPAPSRAALRAALAERYGFPFTRLVVTQLGAGVASDRGAQVQAVAAMMERRADVLHLVVAWPTAVIQPAWFGWARTRVVRTHHADVLSAAADLTISAAGYNSFHEALYGARPTIFVPQTGSYMDDQAARARAAAERGLAVHVAPEALMLLDREIGRLLDGGEAEALRGRLQAAELPEPGTAAAARIIEEVADGTDGLAGRIEPHRAAGRG